jgi:lysophospholipase L1-like esterase
MRRLLIVLRGILCVVVVVSVLEICARVDDVLSYGAPFWGAYSDESLYTIDKIGKWGKPNARYEHWQLNSLGYRGPELVAGTVRVVCIGASETFGLYEAPDEEYPRQLERDLNKLAGGPVFQVVNVAYPGENIRTAILRVPEIASQIRPSYALIYPAFANYISPAPTSARPAPAENSEAGAGPVFELRIVNRVRNLLKSALPEAAQTKLRQRQIEHDTAHLPLMERLPEENVELFREDLTTLISALRDHHVEPVLVTHATAFGSTATPSNRDLLTAWRKFYPVLKEDGFIDMEQRMNQVVRETANREKLVLIDVANEIPPRREYFADFVHFTTAGAELMAGELATGLEPAVFDENGKAREAFVP